MKQTFYKYLPLLALVGYSVVFIGIIPFYLDHLGQKSVGSTSQSESQDSFYLLQDPDYQDWTNRLAGERQTRERTREEIMEHYGYQPLRYNVERILAGRLAYDSNELGGGQSYQDYEVCYRLVSNLRNGFFRNMVSLDVYAALEYARLDTLQIRFVNAENSAASCQTTAGFVGELDFLNDRVFVMDLLVNGLSARALYMERELRALKVHPAQRVNETYSPPPPLTDKFPAPASRQATWIEKLYDAMPQGSLVSIGLFLFAMTLFLSVKIEMIFRRAKKTELTSSPGSSSTPYREKAMCVCAHCGHIHSPSA